MNKTFLELGYELLKSLGITTLIVYPDKLEITKTFDKQQIIAWGKTETEVVENFYYLYQELMNPS